MGAEELQLLQTLLETANGKHGGNLAILKSANNWRISFSAPDGKAEMDAMPAGRTFVEAAKTALAADAKAV